MGVRPHLNGLGFPRGTDDIEDCTLTGEKVSLAKSVVVKVLLSIEEIPRWPEAILKEVPYLVLGIECDG